MPLRRRLPNFGGLDLSPVIVLLGIFFLERVILYYVYPAVMGF
jgi:YggT family protein